MVPLWLKVAFERLVLFKVDMGDSCFFSVVVLVAAGLGVLCLYYGNNCKNAELRANHTHVCKDIHNDDSARALQAFGGIFLIINCLIVAAVVSRALRCLD